MNALLEFLSEFNGPKPGLVAFFLALLALVYARREYRSKNYPIFTWTVDLLVRPDGSYLNLIITNHAEHPIGVFIKTATIVSSISTIEPNFEKEISLPIKGKKGIFIHHFDPAFIDRLRGSESVATLSLKARSQSVLDWTKRLKWSLQTEMKFLSDGTVQTKSIKDRLEVELAFGILGQKDKKE